MHHKIAPSILSADFSRIVEQMQAVERGGATYVHIDVMDGRFVPNITWGPKVVGDLRKHTKLCFDCHLMIVEPERYVEAFRIAGADIITFHLEATPHAQRLLTHIRSMGAKAGIAICPQTPVAMLEDLIDTLPLHRHAILQRELVLLGTSLKRAFPDLDDQRLAESGDLQGIGGNDDEPYDENEATAARRIG